MNPLSLKGLFTSTYDVWRKNVLLYCGLSAVFTLVVGFPYWLNHLASRRSALLTILGTLLATILYAAGMIVFSGIIAGSVTGQLQGRAVVRGEILETAKRSRRLAGDALKAGLRITVGLCALIVPGVVLRLRWLVMGPVICLEKSEDAATRSDALMEGHHGVLFGFLLLIGFASLLGTYLSSNIIALYNPIMAILAHSFEAVGICVAYDRAVADLNRRSAVLPLA
jgi:hypothetical protein